jgi:hypothetical protein
MIVAGLGPGAGRTVALFNATTATSVGSFAAGDPSDISGIRIRVADQPDPTSGARPILVAPLYAPDGTGEQPFDPSQFINPDQPAVTAGPTTSISSSGTSGFDLSSLFRT